MTATSIYTRLLVIEMCLDTSLGSDSMQKYLFSSNEESGKLLLGMGLLELSARIKKKFVSGFNS